MKKMIVVAMLVAFACTVAYAADQVKYEAKNGTVTFNHKAHGEAQGCTACHEGTPAKIEVNKEAAHGALCKDCHKQEGAGPTDCKGCHKK